MHSLSVSKEGRIMATGEDGRIKVWELSSQRVMRKYIGHAAAVITLHISDDSKYLISSAGDRFVCLWHCDVDSTSSSSASPSDESPFQGLHSKNLFKCAVLIV